MIEELERSQLRDNYGNVYGEAPVSEYEIVEKINEIIRYINEKEEKEAVTRPVTKTVTRL